MAKNLNVSLAFTANTNEAIAAIKRLQKELNGLATGASLKDSGISQLTPEIQRAMVAAGELQAKLEAATNLKTGKLDLGQFSDSLKKGGVSLQQYANQLNALGPAGRQAFTNLAQSVLQAEAPLIRCSQRVRELGTTLANTARWQLSSSILHGFMGTVQSAYGYAQDLNKSLNDIRIVTGASVEEMDAFAAKANKAARALSTTTNEYAKASLIYFQQGDTQAQAMDKAAITTKMANVTGQSAEIVSNQLTAIWNNFNKEGDVAYEHYADVLTKLGAATASSTDEIAGGLEKFAGIADQIGLSYEYAASALATITATSRESEEVVGTALKTIFARIQGLNLGETLDDGTTLNKYSEALNKVGISIFDQGGKIKDMDDILEEMADKWKTLGKDQQTALAQTVAGVRQYTQLVTLMDNWDFMDQNLATAMSADGELDKQAEIYAESWEAARDRVTAAAESLYTKILDDDFFIGFLDGLSHVIDGVGSLVDAFGGLGGVLATVGAIATKVFHKEIAQGLRNAAYSIKQFTPAGRAEHEKTKEEALEGIRSLKSNMRGREGAAENASLDREVHMQEKLRAAAGRVTEEELKQLQVQMDLVRAMDQRAIAAGKAADAAREEMEDVRDLARAYEKIEARDKAKADFEKAHPKGIEAEATQKGRETRMGAFESITAYASQNLRHRQNEYIGKNGEYVSKAYKAAKDSVIASGAEATPDAIQSKFLEGLHKAEQAGDPIAKSILEKVRAAGEQASKDFSESMKGGVAKAMDDAAAEAAKKFDQINEAVDKGAMTEVRAKDLRQSSTALKQSLTIKDKSGQEVYKTADTGLGKVQDALKQKLAATTAEAKQLQAALAALGKTDSVLDGTIADLENMTNELNQGAVSAERLDDILGQLSSEEEGGITSVLQDQAQMLSVEAAGTPYGGETSADAKTRGGEDYLRSKQAAQKQMDSENADLNVQSVEGDLDGQFNKSGMEDWADSLTKTTDLIMGIGSAISSVQGAIDVFNDPDATGWDKVSALISVIIGVLPVASSLMTMFGTTAATAGTTAGAGMTAALGPIGLIILAVTAVIALFVLLGSAIAANSPEGQLKSAQEATEKTAQAAQNAKSAYEDLLTTINKYDSAKEALEGLAKGTDEYTEKLLEANEAARELIDTYGLASDEFHVDENGLIQIDKDALDEKKKEYNNRVEDTSSALTGAQKFENKKEDAVTRSNLRNEVNNSSMYRYSDYQNHLITTGNIDKVMQDAAADPNAYFAEGEKNIAETMGWDLENLSTYQQDFINAIMNNASALEEANAAILANAAANEAATKAQLAQNLSDEESFQDSKYQDELLGAALNTQGQTEADAADTLAGMTQDQMYDAYAEMMGYTNNGIGTWLDGKQEFLDADGNKIELTPEQVKAQMTEMYSQQGMEANALNLVETMDKVMARADENKGVISTAITGDTDKLTIGQQNMNASDVAAMVTDEEAISMGFESAAAFGESFAAATENFAGEWQNAMSGYVESVQDQMQSMYDDGKLNNLTLAQSESLAAAYETAYANSGQAGMDALTSMFDKTGEYSDEFATALGTIDWSTATPETLQAALEDAGVATKFTSGELENLIDVMYDGAIGVDAAAEKYKNLSEVMSSLKSGDTISAEEFESLGPGMEDYFMRMADGTYKLIGDAEAFYEAVSAESLEGFENTVREKTADNEQIENVLNHDIASLGTVGGQNPYAMGGHSYMGNGQYAMNTDAANAQLDFLEQSGYEDLAQIQQWREDMAAGTLDVVALTNAVNDQTVALGGAAAAEEYLTQQMDANNTEIAQSKEAIASTATSLDELSQMYADGRIDLETYKKAREAIFESEVEAEGFDVEEINAYAEALQNLGGEHEITAEESQRLALQLSKMKRGLTSLSDNWDDWSDAMKKGDLDSKAKAITGMRKALSDLTGIDMSELPATFFESAENAKLLEKAAQGDEQAINDLMAAATKEIILTMGLDSSTASSLQGLVDDTINSIEVNDLEVGASLDATGMTAAFQALLDSGAVTVDQMNSILSGIGFEPEITMQKVPINNAVANADGNTYTVEYLDTEGNVQTKTITADQYNAAQSSGFIEFPVINGSTTSYTGGGGGINKDIQNNKGGGGGGGSKPKKAETVKKGDVVERYKEVNDDLDDLKEKLDEASKAADRLYGADRLKQMQAQNDIIKGEIDLLKKKKKEAEEYLKQDKKALIETGKENGLNFTFDAEGNIENYEQQMSILYDQLNAAIEKANADGNATEEEQEAIDKIQEKIDAVTEAITQYDETRELNEDLDTELDDKFYAWQDNNAEMLNYQLELKMEVNDMELEKIEYYLGKIEDNFYKMAEAGALMLGSLNPDTLGEGGQLGVYLQQLEDYKTQLKNLEQAYANGEISQAAYIESLKNVKSGIYESLESLQELDKTMMNYYGDTIAMAQDELAKYTDQMEHHSSVLEHYSTILELTGKSNDYEALGVVLEGQAKTAENQVKVAKQTMDMYKNQANDRFAEYQKALAAGDEAAAELYLKQYEEALNAANEAEEEYLSSAEEWAESLRAVLENTMSKLAQTLENTLTGGTSFDQMTTAMERAASLQEEYLTTTNQIYETNKLMRTAQQEIDKTTNTVAKNKLRGFIEETQQLQNQSELSQYELEIQQAKYDLLLAEIALEEAQDAKSMVRLQRDAEGNFGYVYTADSSAVSEAEQQLADAQNNLYNIGLEGANGYTEKYQQTMSEMYDTLQDLQQQKLDGMFETEQEYQDAVTAAKEYYYDKLKQYSNLYSVALTTDNRVVVDAWSSDFAEMTARTDDWMVAVNEYIGGVQDALTLYEEQMNAIAVETVGGDLDTIKDKTKDITTANDELVDKITNPEDGVIKAITDEMDAVANLTGKYANLRTTIQGLMGDYEDLTETIDETVEDTTENGDNNTGKPPEEPEPPAPTEPDPPAEDPTTAETGPTYQKGTLTWSGNGGNRVWKDSAGNKYTYGSPEQKAIQKAFDKAYSANGGYHGDYWIDWGKLNADVLHKKYGLATGGYTGDWAGSYGKLAFLHQKELVLNRGDTENFLASMEVMERILQMIDLQSASSQLGGILSSPTLGSTGPQTIEQQINIEAHFPDATDRFEIEEAFMSMANLASQYANRK